MDTNAVIEFLAGNLPISGSTWINDILKKGPIHLSVINKIELLGFNGEPSEMQTLEDFVDANILLPISDQIVNTLISLRKTYRIKLPDAVIAATALTHYLTLITRNTSDFQAIPGLLVVNAHEK